MSNQKIREWLKSEYPNLIGSFSMTNKGISIIDIIHQYNQDQSGWVSIGSIEKESSITAWVYLKEEGLNVYHHLYLPDINKSEWVDSNYDVVFFDSDTLCMIIEEPLPPTEEAGL